MIRFEFTEVPPSLNNSTTVFKGRKIKSSAYRKWCDKADMELIGQPGQIDGPCYWSAYILIPGAGVRSDLMNLEKAITDAIVRAGRIPDDRYCVDLRIRSTLATRLSRHSQERNYRNGR